MQAPDARAVRRRLRLPAHASEKVLTFCAGYRPAKPIPRPSSHYRDEGERIFFDVHYHGRVRAGDPAYGVYPLDHGRELLPVRARDPRHAVTFPGDIEHGHHLRYAGDLLLSGDDVGSADVHDSHVLISDLHEIDIRAVPADYTFGLEVLHPLDQRGRMDIQGLGYLPVRALAGGAEKLDYAPVQFVESFSGHVMRILNVFKDIY
jgi:hypothetical protein